MSVRANEDDQWGFYRSEVAKRIVPGFSGEVVISAEKGVVQGVRPTQFIKYRHPPGGPLSPDENARNDRCLEDAFDRIAPDFYGKITITVHDGRTILYRVDQTFKDF